MTISVHALASTLQTLLTEVAKTAAKQSGFIRRVRKITGAGFVQALVLQWMADPKAKQEDLAATLGVTTAALQERFNAQAVACLQRVLNQALGCLFQARPETIPLLRRFPAVILEDSTTSPLPASLAREFPGCGGSDAQTGQAGLKLLARLEVITGAVQLLDPRPARTSDRTLSSSLPPLPPGSLRLADLGFFNLQRLSRDSEQGLFWISRVPAKLTVHGPRRSSQNIADWLRGQTSDRIDTIVGVGATQELTCRLMAVRTPRSIAEQRLKRLRKTQKKKGRRVSNAQRLMCEWTVLITNLVDTERFPPEALWVLYRVRWQVELLFKRWKDGGGLATTRARTGATALCECLAKLLAVLIQHWATLLRGGPLCVVSATRACARVRRITPQLAEALKHGVEPLVAVLKTLKAELDRLPRRPRRKRPTTRQLLFAPRFTH